MADVGAGPATCTAGALIERCVAHGDHHRVALRPPRPVSPLPSPVPPGAIPLSAVINRASSCVSSPQPPLATFGYWIDRDEDVASGAGSVSSPRARPGRSTSGEGPRVAGTGAREWLAVHRTQVQCHPEGPGNAYELRQIARRWRFSEAAAMTPDNLSEVEWERHLSKACWTS